MNLILSLLLLCGGHERCSGQEQQCKFAAQYLVYKNSDCEGELKGDLADACDLVFSQNCNVKP